MGSADFLVMRWRCKAGAELRQPAAASDPACASPAAAACLPQGIEARDGHPCDIDDLWLTDGASPAVHYLMKALLRNEQARLARGTAPWLGCCCCCCCRILARCLPLVCCGSSAPGCVLQPHGFSAAEEPALPMPRAPSLCRTASCAPSRNTRSDSVAHMPPAVPQDCILCPIPQYPL